MSVNSEQLFFEGDLFFDAVVRAIDQAQDEIFLESYILHVDQVGLFVLEALARAANRGVKVSVLVDGFGSLLSVTPIRQFCESNGIQFRAYHPIPFVHSRHVRVRNVLRMVARFFRRVNFRNHRKVVIVDGNLVYAGSFNFVNAHSAKYGGPTAWRDTGINVEDHEVARVLREAFMRAWRGARGWRSRPLRYSGVKPLQGRVRLNDSFVRRFQFGRDVRRKLLLAREKILITNAYFLPRRSFLTALRRAARRGVYVSVCVPSRSDVWFVREASRVLYRRLLRWGVRIFEYQPTMLHAKTLVIDQWAAVGSHNLNHRSFVHDLEVEISITNPASIRKLEAQWDVDVINSRPVRWSDLEGESLFRTMIGQLFYMLRYWL